jgi:hypothetical protein
MPENVLIETRMQVLHAQLERMRAMLGRYFDHFYRLVMLAIVALIIMTMASMTDTFRATALLIPFFVIWVGVQSAYFLTYVFFARVYATGIEQRINQLVQEDVLIAHRIEAEYLFPLGGAQFAGVPLRADQTFVGFITIHFWLLGGAAILLSAYRAWQLLPAVAREFPPAEFYFAALIAWAILNLVYLLWYFGTRRHEQRIMRVVRDAYGTDFRDA